MRASGVRKVTEWVANLSRSASAEARARELDDGALAAGNTALTLASGAAAKVRVLTS